MTREEYLNYRFGKGDKCHVLIWGKDECEILGVNFEKDEVRVKNKGMIAKLIINTLRL